MRTAKFAQMHIPVLTASDFASPELILVIQGAKLELIFMIPLLNLVGV
jgi:hypothetical protein